MARPSIIFLIPYFGKWPFWMPFFLESCRQNPDINWHFFTDCGTPDNVPANTRFQALSFTEYCRQVSDRLDIDFSPTSAYKLCDLKPALGLVHQESIHGYDFWGFSDIDLIYGQLRDYFTDTRLARRDLFSTHERRVSGHLCLIRNTPSMRHSFQQVPNWASLIAGEEHVAFDEGPYSRLFIRLKRWPQPLRHLLLQGNPLYRRSEFTEAFSTPNGRIRWHDGSLNFPKRWTWCQGRLTNDRDGSREFPYIHFIAWKWGEAWKSQAEQNTLADPELPHRACWHLTTTGFSRCSA